MQTPIARARTRPMAFLLAVLGGLWIVASSRLSEAAARGLTLRTSLTQAEFPLQQFFWLFLMLLGFSALGSSIGLSGLRTANCLPARATVRQEWLKGVALGWAMLLIAALPLMLIGALHPQFTFTLSAVLSACVSLVGLFLGTLAIEVAFRGYLFSVLTQAFGLSATNCILALAFAAVAFTLPNGSALSVLIAFAAGLFLALARLRTNGLWLGWGLHFGWSALSGVVLGLPVSGDASYLGPVSTYAAGPAWFTGGAYGLDASIVTLLVLCLAVPALYGITRDYAWQYTHPPLVAAGVPVVIAPPAAHTAMEEAAKPSLVQILPSTPTAVSTSPMVEQHLRGDLSQPTDPAAHKSA